MINKEEISLHFRTASCEEQEDPYRLNFFLIRKIFKCKKSHLMLKIVKIRH